MLEPEINDLPAFLVDTENGQRTTNNAAPNQCFHQITAGHRCNAPALRGEYFCRHHFKRAPLIAPPHSRFEMPEITSRESARAFAVDIAARVAANSLDVQRARTLLSSLRVVLSTLPPQPRNTPGPKAKEDKPLSPDDARKTELWARLFLAREEAKRTGAPDPFDQYPGDLMPKDGKVHVGHSCFAPPGWKPGDPPADELPGAPSELRSGGIDAERTTENAQPTTLSTLRASAQHPLRYHGLQMQSQATAILLLAHGTPDTLGEMADYLNKVVGGRPMPAEVVAELQHRYAEIGLRDEPGAEPPPLTKWTLAQGRSLEAALAAAGTPLPVYIAMRNWHPFIADVVAQMRAGGIARVLAICLAPQNSRTSTGLYKRALMAAVDTAGTAKLDVTFVDEWPEEPALIEAFARRLAETYPRACAEAAAQRGDDAAGQGTALPVLFTAHSVPERTLAATADHPADPYADQARHTAELVFAKTAELLGCAAPREYRFAFQSQGVAGGPWIGPTVEETLAALAKEGHRGVVLQPIGFLCDHVEILYDIDVAFAATARSLNLALFRPESINDSPLLAAALLDIVTKRLPLSPGPLNLEP